MSRTNLARPLIAFGLAGLLPQVICLTLVLSGGPERWFALAAACFYAALILSFLGGVRWGIALGYDDNGSGNRDYIIAVIPALVRSEERRGGKEC